MSTRVSTLPPRAEHPSATSAPSTAAGFNALAAATSGWLVGGLWLDGWAHHNTPGLETFFTPWHGVLYSGLLATTALLVSPILRGRPPLDGRGRLSLLPNGFGLSLVGVAVFAMGGLADMLWHLLLGIEVSLEALLSPPHLVLGIGGVLMVSGPLRAAGRDFAGARGWRDLLPALLSLTFVLALLTFFTEYANPFSTPWPARTTTTLNDALRQTGMDGVPGQVAQSLGVASILLRAALMTGAALFAARRWAPLPFGAIALVFTLDTALGALPHGQYQFVPAALVAGLVGDTVLWWQTSRGIPADAARLKDPRAFAFLVPVTLFGLYFLTLALSGGIAWTVPLWSGSVLLAGGVGLLLNFVAPSRGPGLEAGPIR